MERLAEQRLKEICGNCGCTAGTHLADAYYSEYYGRAFPAQYCPGHAGRMDWDQGPGTVFKSTGRFAGVQP